MPEATKIPERQQDFKGEAFKPKHTITIEIGEAKDPETGELRPATQIGINDTPFSLAVVEDALETLGTWAGEIFVRSCEKATQDPTSGAFGRAPEDLISERAFVFWSTEASTYASAFAAAIKSLYPELDLLTPDAIINAVRQ